MKFISILIPTKNYTFGIERILDYFSTIDTNNIEIIISDDSSDASVGKIVKKFKNRLNYKYFKNNPALGLCENWNKLLGLSKTRYIMFLHNDDFITQKNFFLKLNKILQNHGFPDVVSVATNIIKKKNQKKHILSFLRFLLHKFNPYILRRNFIGPMSSVIIKNRNLPKFNIKLQWLIDVEFLYKLKKKKWIFTDHLIINSEYNNPHSQHRKNYTKIKKILKQEYYYLTRKFKIKNLFLKQYFFFEIFFWIFIRSVNFLILKLK